MYSGSGGCRPVSYTHLDVYKRQVIEEAERIRKQLQQKMCPEEEALLEEILARMKEWRAVLVRCAYAEGYASAVQVCRFRADFRENLEIKEKIIRTLMEIGDPCEEER